MPKRCLNRVWTVNNPWQVHAGRVTVTVRVTPKASRDCLEGRHVAGDGNVSLKVSVRAQPEKGKANKAVIAVLAKLLRQPKSSLAVISGATSRSKVIEIIGDPAAITGKLEMLVS